MTRCCGYCGDEGRLYWNAEERMHICTACHNAGVHERDYPIQSIELDDYVEDYEVNTLLEDWQ